MRRSLLIVLVLMLAAVAAGPASGSEFEPNTRTETVYFKCGTTKAANVNAANGETVTWSTEAPTQSVQQGAGCGHLDSGYADDATLGLGEGSGDAVFEGTFEGNLRDLTVTAWAIDTLFSRAYGDMYTDVTLIIDDEYYLFSQEVILTPESSDTGVSRLFEFTVVGIDLLEEEDDTTHEVKLILAASPYLDSDNDIWVWDTTEVPSGITFNPEELSPNLVPAF